MDDTYFSVLARHLKLLIKISIRYSKPDASFSTFLLDKIILESSLVHLHAQADVSLVKRPHLSLNKTLNKIPAILKLARYTESVSEMQPL